MNSKHLHELIDSCRPGHADVDQPEFSELARELAQDPSLQRLFERSQELDEGIRTAFQAVTPPPGLVERLLAAIETPAIEPVEASPAAAETESHVELARHPTRRSAAIWAGVASLAAVAAITAWFQWPQPSLPISDREIAEFVDRWNADADLDETSWQTTANVPSQEFPTWQHLKISGVERWQWVSKGRGVCYDFAIKGKKVRLFVIKQRASVELPTAPPEGYPSPKGWHVGAWRANGRVYYLAVYAEGGSKRLYSEVKSTPLA